MARCHTCSRFYIDDADPRRKFGTCEDCADELAEQARERIDAEEAENNREILETWPAAAGSPSRAASGAKPTNR